MKYVDLFNHPGHGTWTVTLEDGDDFTPDLSHARIFRVYYEDTVTINDPVNGKPGVYGRFEFISEKDGSEVKFGENFLGEVPTLDNQDEHTLDIVEGYIVEGCAPHQKLYGFQVSKAWECKTHVYHRLGFEANGSVDEIDPDDTDKVEYKSSDDEFKVSHTVDEFTWRDDGYDGTGVKNGEGWLHSKYYYSDTDRKWVLEHEEWVLGYDPTSVSDIKIDGESTDKVTWDSGDEEFTIEYGVTEFTFDDDGTEMTATYDEGNKEWNITS